MRCSRCGAALQQGVAICPECGARQRRRSSAIRCANCHGRVAMELSVCPHCGRELRPAGPRWGLALTSFALVGLLSLWGLGKLPVERLSQEVKETRAKLARLAEISELAVSASLPRNSTGTSLAGEANPTLEPPEFAVQGSPVETQEFVGEAPEIQLETGDETALQVAVVEAAGEVVTTTQPLQTSPGTASPAVTPTVDTGKYYVVQKGDTLGAIGARLGMDWTLIAKANGIGANAVLQIGQRLRLPSPAAMPTLTSTSAPTATATDTELPPTPTRTSTSTATRRALAPATLEGPAPTVLKGTSTPAATTAVPTKIPATPTVKVVPTNTRAGAVTVYRIKSGDSLAIIGERFGVPWQSIASANKITAVTRLQVGQQLIIPVPGASTQATAAPAPKPTATPTPAPARPALPAPVLDSPSDGTPFQGDDALIELKWSPIPGMPPDARYQIAIQYTENGVVQVYNQLLTPSVSIRFPTWLFGKADQGTGRRYTWSITAVQPATDGQGGQLNIPLSAPSPSWTLYWN